MFDWTISGPPMLASFMASLVEFVEALTIVLAVGTVRGWRSALAGSGSAVLTLFALVLVLGRSLIGIPLHILQLVVGTMLLLFGMRWLRKAVLRAAGVLALHDEAKAYEIQVQSLKGIAVARHTRIDRIAFATTFKIVMLEGIEVVVIVVGIGAGGGLMLPAAAGAVLALMLVAALGLWLHRPLAKIPENTLKFAVGVMLAAFGTFWVGEGVGLVWPGEDFAILALVLLFLLVATLLVPLCRQRHSRAKAAATKPSGAKPGVLGAAARELVGLFIDDGSLAAGVFVLVIGLWAVAATQTYHAEFICLIFAAGLCAILSASALRRARIK